ncbi:molecular chaperone [Caenimonas terrae]|uniref:Molecular chaperone n=2 Tax=Caenimonas terrae TaxID=696074 RepID=A0ABW0NH53_9BURK
MLGAGWAAVHAQTIAPVLVELTPARRVVSVTMTNTSSRAMTYQAQTVAWTQTEGADRYADSTDLLVVPPVAEIAPGGSQIFRVTLRRPQPAREMAYRLIFEDVTEDISPPADGATVRLQFRHSLPVFAGPPPNSKGQARMAACEPASSHCARLYNDGDHRLRITQVTGEQDGWRGEVKAPATLLAGAWKQWTFEPPRSSMTQPLKVSADTTAGAVSLELPNQGR